MDNYPCGCKTGLDPSEWIIIHSNGKIKVQKKFCIRPLHDQNKQNWGTANAKNYAFAICIRPLRAVLISTGDRKLFDKTIFLPNIFSFPLSSYNFLFYSLFPLLELFPFLGLFLLTNSTYYFHFWNYFHFSISTFELFPLFYFYFRIISTFLFSLWNYFHFSISTFELFPLFYFHFGIISTY